MKYIDIVLCPVLIVIFLPLMLLVGILIYVEDRNSPFYISVRIGKGGKPYNLYKFRSMRAVQVSTVDSTSNNDPRITKTGKWIRRYKIDELPQLFNVLTGTMSLVGPRPNVQREVNLYTEAEIRLLEAKPGMTDFSSVIFSDLGAILEQHDDPDIAYNQLVRPWKGRYGIFYIQKQSVLVDFVILLLTSVVLISRPAALRLCHAFLTKLGASSELVEMSLRRTKLAPLPPAGSNQIVTSRGT